MEAIAVVHVEFILIHPFREGNGRMGRMLASVMAMQASKPELNFSCWDTNKADTLAQSTRDWTIIVQWKNWSDSLFATPFYTKTNDAFLDLFY